jgi:hypothetical protein
MDQGHKLQFMVLQALNFMSKKAKANADYLENLFTPHNLCDENRERRMEARVRALLKSVDNSPPGKNKTL